MTYDQALVTARQVKRGGGGALAFAQLLGYWSWSLTAGVRRVPMEKPFTFLTAAYIVLRDAGRPMTAAEILHEARSKSLLATKGKTPLKTLNARISVDILRLKSRSLFMRADGSRFALREWAQDVPER